jgi:heme exporter protein A
LGGEMTSPMLLRGQGLAVWHGERCLFEGLDFELGPRQLALLVGANGTGKTTLLRVLAGLAEPTHGAVTWNDVPTVALTSDERGDVAYRGHHEALKRDLSLEENLGFHASLWGRGAPLGELLRELKLDHVAGTRARYLSAGQKRRASLAMLALSRAKRWLLDEPTTNLDSDGRSVFAEWTGRHLDAGGLAVIATHQPEEFAARATLSIDLS